MTATACVELGGEVLDSFAVEEGRVVAAIRDEGRWEIVEARFAEP